MNLCDSSVNSTQQTNQNSMLMENHISKVVENINLILYVINTILSVTTQMIHI